MPARKPRKKAPSNQTGGSAWGQKLASAVREKLQGVTVHDELIVEAPEAEAAKAAAILQEEMEGCVNYAVPLSTEVHQGKNWLEAH